MSAFYGLYGGIRLRNCPEVAKIIESLRESSIVDVEVSECEPGVIALFLDGCGVGSSASLLETDDLVLSLGPYTLEPAILISNYEHAEDVFIRFAPWSRQNPAVRPPKTPSPPVPSPSAGDPRLPRLPAPG